MNCFTTTPEIKRFNESFHKKTKVYNDSMNRYIPKQGEKQFDESLQDSSGNRTIQWIVQQPYNM